MVTVQPPPPMQIHTQTGLEYEGFPTATTPVADETFGHEAPMIVVIEQVFGWVKFLYTVIPPIEFVMGEGGLPVVGHACASTLTG